MIDCHAHAYPSAFLQIERVVEKLAPGKGDVVAAAVGQALAVGRSFLERATSGLRGHKPHSPALGVETVARLRKSGPPAVHDLFEQVMSVVMMPSVLVHGQLDELVASMERHGITRTVVIAAPPIATNDWLLGEATLLGDAVVPFVMLPAGVQGIDEHAWHDGLVDLVERGARGFKIHPNMDGLAPDHPAYRAMFELARERAMPIILHTGCFHAPTLYRNPAAADPGHWERWFSEYPDVRVCLAHMNRSDPERAWDVMKRHPHLFTDTSWQPAEAVQRAVREVGVDRILLGSDWPLLHGELQGESLAILRRAVGPSESERIGTTNAHAFLG